MSDDSAKIEISASSSQLDSGLRDAAAKVNRWSLGISSTVARGISGIGKQFSQIGIGGLRRVGSGAADFIADQARSVMDFEKDLVRFGIAGDMTRGQLDAMRTSIRETANETGLASSDVLSAASTYVALTGDVAGASAAMGQFARIAQATGSSSKEVATAAQAIRDNFKIDPSQFEAAFSVLASQGKAGAVELKDFAGELASIAPQFAQYKGMGGVEGLGELGAALQVVRKGFGSASEASNGLRAMLSSITQHAKLFETAGVQIFDKDPNTGAKTMRNFSAIWQDINKSKLVQDPTLLQKAFGRDEAKRAYEQLRQHGDLYEDLIVAGKDLNTVARDYTTYQESAAGKMEHSMNAMKETIARAFTPERIEKFAGAMEKVADAVDRVASGAGRVVDFWTGNDERTNMAMAEITNPFEERSWIDPWGLGKKFAGVDDIASGPASETFSTRMQQYKAMKPEDRIRAAVLDSEAIANGLVGRGWDADAFSPTAMANQAGRREAGKRALTAMGVDEVKAQKIRDEMMRKAIDELPGKFAAAIANVSIAVDGNRVDDAISKSTNARTRR